MICNLTMGMKRLASYFAVVPEATRASEADIFSVVRADPMGLGGALFSDGWVGSGQLTDLSLQTDVRAGPGWLSARRLVIFVQKVVKLNMELQTATAVEEGLFRC
jgi:hypothetical protein